jgi:uncharacterized Zn finger protein (UPF0148 family)
LANEVIHVQFGDVFKFNKQADGSLQVFGKATDETLDGDLQKCDLAWSAKAMEKWLATGGNMRVQHNPSLYPAGVGMSVDVKPDGVYLMAEIAEATAIRLVEKGALRAFSVGISRPKFARDASAPNGRIVGGDIVEVSLVDRPSNPECAFTVKMAGKGDEVHFEGEYTRLPEISSPMNKLMNSIVTKGADNAGDDGDDNDDSGNDVDESSAGDAANNGDGGNDTSSDSDADGKPDDDENDTHGDDSDDKSVKPDVVKDADDADNPDDSGDDTGDDAPCKTCKGKKKIKDGHVKCPTCGGTGKAKDAKTDKSAQDFDGDTDGGEDKTDPADTPDDGEDVDTDGDGDSTDPEDVGPTDEPLDGGSTDTSTDDEQVDEIVEALEEAIGGGDGQDDPEDFDSANGDNDLVGADGMGNSDDDTNKLQYAAMGATLGLDGDRVEWFLGKSSVGTKDEREGAKFKLTVDGETKFPINDCSDVTDAWGLRGHAKGIAVADVEAYIRKAAKALDCNGPWDEGGDGQKTRFADWALRRLHDTTCPAYSNEAVKHAYPSLRKGMDAAAGKTAQQIIFGMLQDSVSSDGGEGAKSYSIENLAKAYSAVCNSVSDAVWDQVRASLGLDKTVTNSDVLEAARDEIRKDAEIDDTGDPGVTVRTKGTRIWYVSEAANAIGKNLQQIHDAVVVVQPDLCTLPAPVEKPITKSVVVELTKAATVDERIDELTTAFEAEKSIMLAKIDKLSALPDFTLLNTPRRRATGSPNGGVDLAKNLSVTDANTAAQEQERQARINWYTDLAKSGATREEREAAEELLEKLRFPDLVK